MSFADNLKQLRKERQLSQEELAEMLDVSRRAISKWEQGIGYPEVEKLLLLSHKLNISLDSLMSTEIVQTSGSGSGNVTGTIVITSPHENVIATCYKVSSSGKCRAANRRPSTPSLESATALRLSGVSRPPFWDGTRIKS